MKIWPQHPVIYEINTWVWLRELSQKYQRPVNLCTVPQEEWDVRCDMAMLMMSDVFERTWGFRAGARPAEDYWPSLIPAVRLQHPEFRFLAEAYWDLEWALQQQGFDYCYDKKFYDRMEHGDAETVRLHLLADMAYQHGLVRFLENHDEPRAAATFAAEKARAAAVTLVTLPGRQTPPRRAV